MLKKANSQMIAFFIDQIEGMKGGTAELMKDKYGNYFC